MRFWNFLDTFPHYSKNYCIIAKKILWKWFLWKIFFLEINFIWKKDSKVVLLYTDILNYSRVPNNSQDLIGVWVRNFYDNLNVNDPIIVYFLTALKSYKWGVLNKSQLNTTYIEKRFLKVTYYIIEWSNHSYICRYFIHDIVFSKALQTFGLN